MIYIIFVNKDLSNILSKYSQSYPINFSMKLGNFKDFLHV